MTIEQVAENKSAGGWHKQYRHPSSVTGCMMRFAIFLPPQAVESSVPVLYWLSGLTCTDENFMQKAGAQRVAAELGLAIVAPDTSPRGEQGCDLQGAEIADDLHYDLGQGAGFYVNATQVPWAKHFQMYDYVLDELPRLIEREFPVTSQRAIAGHSMGGHGALTIGLRNPSRYQSISAFSPICHPSNCPWGEKAFSAYLGDERGGWGAYDACTLLAACSKDSILPPILIDQGLSDSFLAEQLKPEALSQVAQRKDLPLAFRYHEGYDHSYYFIASFIEEHLRFHWRHLQQ